MTTDAYQEEGLELAHALFGTEGNGGSQSTPPSDAQNVTGIGGLTGDPNMLQMSMRQATDKVADVNDSAELTKMLRRATQQGDEIMARAIAGRALALRYTRPLHQFVKDRPELDAAVERLWESTNPRRARGERQTLLTAPPRVEEAPRPPGPPEFEAANPRSLISPPPRPDEDYSNIAADLFGHRRG
ncbi:hypothetical protein FDO65_07020 [Nakamurella flava]|uniref:Uncharacterized protein n=1 Tax=Nakamurella flava TaxID=2576308 RepID=A0A4U6QLG5_9ACTN|nr:hypothetical protein [Nakamurella flava]TKV61343.1 hypothetical protein FDO65_07020 [Nakamurella flava]